MEVINLIWGVLNSENVVLMYVIDAIAIFVEATLYTLIFVQLLNIKTTKSHIFKFIACVSIVVFLYNLLITLPLNFLFSPLIFIIFARLFFKATLLRTLLGFVIPFVFLALVASAVQALAKSLLGISLISLMTIPIHKITFGVITFSLMYFIGILLKHHNITMKLHADTSRPLIRNLYLNILASLIVLLIHSYLFTIHGDYLPNSVLVVSITTLLLYSILSIYNLVKSIKLLATQEALHEKELRLKDVENSYHSVISVEHDYHNIIAALARICMV